MTRGDVLAAIWCAACAVALSPWGPWACALGFCVACSSVGIGRRTDAPGASLARAVSRESRRLERLAAADRARREQKVVN